MKTLPVYLATLVSACFLVLAGSLHAVDVTPASLTVTPDPIAISVRSGESSTLPLQLSNPSTNPVSWNLEFLDAAGKSNHLAELLGAVNGSGTALNGPLPDRYDFTEGETGTSIVSGTPSGYSAVFSTGNMLKTNLGGPLAYANGSVTTSATLGASGSYFTRKLPGIFLFAGELDAVSWFEISGTIYNAQARQTSEFTVNRQGKQWSAFVVRFKDFYRTTNQLVLVDRTGLSQTTGTANSDEKQRINGLTGKCRVLYALFVTSNTTFQPDAVFLNLANRLLDLAPNNLSGILSASPTSATVAAESAAAVPLTANAVNASPGNYGANLALVGNDSTRLATVPVTVSVTSPRLVLPSDPLNHINIVGGPASTQTVAIRSGLETEQPWTAQLLTPAPWLTLTNPTGTTPDPLELRFTPGTLAVGAYATTLRISSGAASFDLPVTFWVEPLAPMALRADPLRPRLYALNKGNKTGQVLVLSETGAITKVIAVGNAPQDCAFSPDGKFLYTANGSESISEIDLTTLEVTRTRAVTLAMNFQPTRFKLAVGNNGRIYHGDGAMNPTIRVIDFNTGALLSTYAGHGVGGLAFDNLKQRLYCQDLQHQYHTLMALTPQGDTLTDLTHSEFRNSRSDSASYSTLLSSLNGDRIAAMGRIYQLPAMSIMGNDLPVNASAMSAYGHLIAGGGQLLDATSGTKVADLPVSTNLIDFTREQASLLYYNSSTSSFVTWNIPSAIRPPAIGISPQLPPGGVLPDDAPVLTWNGVPFAQGYRVFVGTDRSAVENAIAGSPEDCGVVTTNSFNVSSVAPSGSGFYWRIVPIREVEPITGPVFTATRAAFQLTPANLALRFPLGMQPQQVTLQVRGHDGEPVAWSVTESIPWFTPTTTSGAAGTPLTGTISFAGLGIGSHAGTLAVESGGLSLTANITFTLYTPDLSLLRADPSRPWVYALHKGTASFQESQVLAIRADTGKIEKALSIGSEVSDFSINPVADRLYAIAKGNPQAQVVDLAAFSLLPPLTVPTDVTAVAADRNGRLFLQRSSQFEIRDAATGVLLGQRACNGSLATEIDPSGRFYFDVSTLMNQEGIEAFDVSSNTPVALPLVKFSGDSGKRLVISADGSRIFYRERCMNLAREFIAATGEPVNATVGNGAIVIGDTKVWWAQSGIAAASLPFTATLSAVSAGDEFLVLYNASARTLTSVRLDSLVSLPGPNPQPGVILPPPGPVEFNWGPVAQATSYRIFLGNSQSEVATAATGSPLHVGTTTTPQWLPASPLAYGYRYYWRVDAVSPGGTVAGAVWYFDVPMPAVVAPISLPNSYYDKGARLHASAGGLAAGPADNSEIRLFDLDPVDGRPVFRQSLEGVFSTNSTRAQQPVIGDRVVVIGERSDTNGGSSAGALAVNERWQGSLWHYSRRVVPPSLPTAAWLGSSLVTDGNLFLAGMRGTNSVAGRVAAYQEWPDFVFMQEFRPSDGVVNDGFGAAISMQGNRALIGAPGHYTRQGRAYLFEFSASTRTWSQRVALVPTPASGPPYYDSQGGAVALDGDRAVLGSTDGSPQVQVFTRSTATSWPQTATITYPLGTTFTDGFGKGLALTGDTLFVAAPTAQVFGETRGIVYVYHRIGAEWRLGSPIRPPAGTTNFGTSMAVRDGVLYVSSTGGLHSYQIAAASNRLARFVTSPPIQMVTGAAVNVEIVATDADGNAGLTFQAEALPTGVTLLDLGGGNARLQGTPTAAKGVSQFARWRVTDSAGVSVYQSSMVTMLAVTDVPQFSSQPVSQTAGAGMDVVLRAAVTGVGPFTWQWQKDGQDIANATTDTLYLEEVDAAHAGVYTVKVRNGVGELTSNPTTLTVVAATRNGGDWETFGHSASRDGHYPAALAGCAMIPAWTRTAQSGSPLHRAVISGGRTFVVPNSGGFTNGNSAKAFDLATGAELWAFPIASSFSYNPPTVHGGRVYFQRGQGVSDPIGPQLFCLNGATGAQVWASVFQAQWDSYQAPAVTDSGIFINGGYYGGMYGFEPSGTQRFYRSNLSSYDDWTPAIHRDRLFSWTAGTFAEHDLKDGSTYWNIHGNWSHDAYSMNTLAALQGSSAVLICNESLACVDIDKRSIRWEVPLRFTGSPAIFGATVYALQGTAVRSYSLADGTPGRVFQTTATSGGLTEQPLVFNDRLLVTNSTTTWVFDLADGRLLQTVNAGGKLSYSNGYLLIAGADGVLRAFRALHDNANLADLSLNGGTILPAFETSTPDYIATVPFATDRLTVTPTIEQSDATVKVNRTTVTSGTASNAIALALGNTTIPIVVTAEDGITIKTYTITVTRLPQNFVFNSASDVPVTANGFSAGGHPVNIVLNYAPEPGAVLTMVNNTGLGFIAGRFDNLDQGQRVTLNFGGNAYDFVANYYGGTGNDLVLQWADARLFAWGSNSYGQLGNATTSQRLVSTPVNDAGVLSGKTITTAVGAYLHSLALCSDGTLAAWGYNVFGQLGNDDSASSSVPVAVDRSGVLAGRTVVAISAGPFHNLALCSDGTVVAWGYNNYGQLGTGDKVTNRVPVRVKPLGALAGKSVVGIAAGAYHSFALCSDGTVAGWGYNDEGELGDGSVNTTLIPVMVSASGSLSGRKVASLAAGQYHTLALCTDGTLHAWGYNKNGQLGDNSTVSRKSPVAIGSFGALAGKPVSAISAGASHSMATCSDGSLAVWGLNAKGQLGSDGLSQSLVPVPVGLAGLSGVRGSLLGASHSMVVTSDATLYGWGDNASGQLGNNSTVPSASPLLWDAGSFEPGMRLMSAASGASSQHVFAIMAGMNSVRPLAAAQEVVAQGDGAISQDSDQDSITDLLEYAFGLNPNLADAGGIPQAVWRDGSMEFRFVQPAGVLGVLYSAEWSASLKTGEWFEIPDQGTGSEHIFRMPAHIGGRCFMRLKVTRP